MTNSDGGPRPAGPSNGVGDSAKPDRARKPGGDLAARVLSAVILAPIALGAVIAGGWPFVLFWALAACGVCWEWQRIVLGPADGAKPLAAGIAALAAAAVLVAIGLPAWSLLVLAAGAAAAAILAPARPAWAAAGVGYAGAMLLAPVVLRAEPHYGTLAIFFLFAVVWATDILGYFVGRLIGGPRLAPAISPKKTWSGALGGLVGAALAAFSLAIWAGVPSPVGASAAAILLCIASQAGDLFESAVKRRFDVKDSSGLIPGHGGLMDRLDGFVAAAVLAALIGVIHNGIEAPAKGLLVW